MLTAEILIYTLQIWGILGAVVALVFLTIGLERIDEDARLAYAFRPLLIPGILMIWPIVVWRCWKIESQSEAWANRYRPLRAVHGLAAILMAIAILLALGGGLYVRQNWPASAVPVQLSAGPNE